MQADAAWVASVIRSCATEEFERMAGMAGGSPANPVDLNTFFTRLAESAAKALVARMPDPPTAPHVDRAVAVADQSLTVFTAMLARELVDHAKRRGAARGAVEPHIGTALASATVYYARECGLSDDGIVAVFHSAMADHDGELIGPPIGPPTAPRAKA